MPIGSSMVVILMAVDPTRKPSGNSKFRTTKSLLIETEIILRQAALSDQETVDDFLGYYWFTENADSQRIEYQR
jgi:hypothetical protein